MKDHTADAQTPVLLMLFNRPETTQKVFDALRAVKPANLYVAANGPRPGVPEDVERCAAVQKIFNGVDWPCEVHTNFRESNIGMQPHFYLALDWIFETEENCIVLEDDCIPHPDFFGYCQSLLARYKDDARVMQINGSNFQFGEKRGKGSYYFSKYPHTWGWATWKRAWGKFDKDMRSFPEFKQSGAIDAIATSPEEKAYWMKFFESLYNKEHDGTDAKWLYAVWSNDGLCATANVNMISNIGHGLGAGHTIIKEKTMGQEAKGMPLIVHPSAVVRDRDADALTFKIIFHRSFFQKALYKTVMAFSKLLR